MEEYTGDIHEDKENLIRSIINCGYTSTGRSDGTNLTKNLKSSIVIDGERAPE
jgi:hypothetical protein